MDGCMYVWMDGWMDGWMLSQTESINSLLCVKLKQDKKDIDIRQNRAEQGMAW